MEVLTRMLPKGSEGRFQCKIRDPLCVVTIGTCVQMVIGCKCHFVNRDYLITKIYSSSVICQPEELGLGIVHTYL